MPDSLVFGSSPQKLLLSPTVTHRAVRRAVSEKTNLHAVGHPMRPFNLPTRALISESSLRGIVHKQRGQRFDVWKMAKLIQEGM